MAKTLLPIGITSAAITALFSVTAMPSRPGRAGHVSDAVISFLIVPWFFFVTMALFSALGLLLLQPIVRLIQKRRLPFGLALATLTAAGAVVGWIFLLWMSKSAWIGAAAGAATAAIWFIFNRDSLRSRPEAE